MEDTISRHSIVVAVEGQVSCDLDDEVAILDIASGIYYGLNAVGAHIWNLIQNPRSVSEVCSLLVEAYEVEPERCEHDALALLQTLKTKGLIQVKDAMI